MSMSVKVATPVTEDPRLQEVQEYIHQGDWAQAVPLLEELAREYPEDRTVQVLLQDAQLRASLVEIDERPRRRLPHISRRAFTIAVLVVVFVGLSLGIYGGYVNYIRPAGAEARFQATLQATYDQAVAALANGNYEKARELFQQVLAQNPNHPGAQEGLKEAEERKALAQSYQQALDLLAEGRRAEALQRFQEIAARNPEYRDVQQRIAELEKEKRAEELFQQAEEAYKNGEWRAAAEAYEALRELDGSFRREQVTNRLLATYMNYAREILNTGQSDGPDIALEYVRKALGLDARDQEARALRQDLTTYLRGRRAFARGDYLAAVQYWEPLYERDANFAGGLLARQLYTAYLELGRRREREDNLPSALRFYTLATQLPVTDTSEAQQRLHFLISLLTPTPTPTPTPTATPTPTPIPTPTPTPTPLPLAAFPGWIAFKTDRRGAPEVWVMRPDGCCAQPISDPQTYEELKERQSLTLDGTARVYVESPGQSSVTAIYIWRNDLPPNWERRFQLLDNSAINYDPVWSPDAAWIAFVSQKSGGDEIWKVSSDYTRPQEPIRLTWNTWEWDKSPTWSPDGKYIAFWSNRETGRKQIWVMDADGENQHNISNNEYNDWDPVWIWPQYFQK